MLATRMRMSGAHSNPLLWSIPEGAVLFGEDGSQLVAQGDAVHDVECSVGMVVFRSTGTYSFVIPENFNDHYATAVVLVVAGGGGGSHSTSYNAGGGGGAGGLRRFNTYAVAPGVHTVIVGAGRAAGWNNSHLHTGGNSQFSGITCTGGGNAGGAGGDHPPADGGSGGGPGGWDAGPSMDGGSGISGQGYRGGNRPANNPYGRGGGGKAGAASDSTWNSTGPGQTHFGTLYSRGGRGGSGATGTSDGANGAIYCGHGGGGAQRGESTGDNRGGDGSQGIVIMCFGGFNKNYNPATNTCS